MTACPDCGSEHLGPRCRMTFAQRIRTVQIDRENWDTAEKHNYYDASAVAAMFGRTDIRDNEEIYMDETQGRGAVTLKDDPALVASYVDGPEVDDAD